MLNIEEAGHPLSSTSPKTDCRSAPATGPRVPACSPRIRPSPSLRAYGSGRLRVLNPGPQITTIFPVLELPRFIDFALIMWCQQIFKGVKQHREWMVLKCHTTPSCHFRQEDDKGIFGYLFNVKKLRRKAWLPRWIDRKHLNNLSKSDSGTAWVGPEEYTQILAVCNISPAYHDAPRGGYISVDDQTHNPDWFGFGGKSHRSKQDAAWNFPRRRRNKSSTSDNYVYSKTTLLFNS